MEPAAAVIDTAQRTVEAVARESYGRLVSYLAARTRDVAGAQDALSEAFLAALGTWPRAGVPDKPEAWLLTAARRRLIDRERHKRVAAEAALTLQLVGEAADEASRANPFPDERLKLLFTCAHPAIDREVHTPLMLQTVLGLDAARIARAFLVQPSAMSQRLVRAKGKIRDAGIAFEVPDETELPQRLDAVLEAIYAAYGSGWEELSGSEQLLRGLAEEAIWLARVLARLMPDEPEVQGLLALMLCCEARRSARRTRDGHYVPISDQDVRLWSEPMIQEAERELTAAAAQSRSGRFQLEAAIQSVHIERARTGRTDWEAIALLYEGLIRVAPTLGALVGRAAAVAEARGPETGMAYLNQIEAGAVTAYQPYWAVRGHLLHTLERQSEASAAFDRAIALTRDEAVRAFFLRRRGA
jgi:RNA polymerase sigma-70 factor (ECF subfamily)